MPVESEVTDFRLACREGDVECHRARPTLAVATMTQVTSLNPDLVPAAANEAASGKGDDDAQICVPYRRGRSPICPTLTSWLELGESLVR